MRGILEHLTRGWVVKEIIASGPDASLVNFTKLSDSDINLMALESNWKLENTEVEFEKVLGNCIPGEEINYVAKLILPDIGSSTGTSLISRIEVIDDVTGRLFVKYFDGEVKLDYQDSGKTLKIFIKTKK